MYATKHNRTRHADAHRSPHSPPLPPLRRLPASVALPMAMADAAAWLLLSSVRVLPAACTGGSAPRGASRVARVLSLLSVDCSECSTNYNI